MDISKIEQNNKNRILDKIEYSFKKESGLLRDVLMEVFLVSGNKSYKQDRLKHWRNNNGVPEIKVFYFVDKYNNLINSLIDSSCDKEYEEVLIRIKSCIEKFNYEYENTLYSILEVYSQPEIKNNFVCTFNNQGYMIGPVIDDFVREFINLSNKGCKVLDVGAAFGAVSLQAYMKGATVGSVAKIINVER